MSQRVFSEVDDEIASTVPPTQVAPVVNELVFFINKVLVAGTIIGSIYALGAVGVTLVYSILRFAHFAHGDMMTAGSFISFLVSLILATVGFNPPVLAVYLALPIAMVLPSFLIAVSINRYEMRVPSPWYW